MIKRFFAYDGTLMGILYKIGELIMLSVVYLICCIPLVTIGSATASLYYAVMKSVRRDCGTPIKEFFGSMKRTLGRGCLYTIIIALWYAALWLGRSYSIALNSQTGDIMLMVYLAIMIMSLGIVIYIFPILSRFRMSNFSMWKLAFVMSMRFFPITVALVVGTVLIGLVYFYELPAPCILFIPGLWCWVTTFLMERALLAYMPKPKEGEEAWYYPPKKDKHESDEHAEKR